MIPHQYLVPYLVSNAVALAMFGLAFRRPQWVRFATAAIFLWAAWTNSRITLFHPGDYQTFGELAVVPIYRRFIYGWFSLHTAELLLPIALGQLAISTFLLGPAAFRLVGSLGAVVFLLAIAPLGVGSAFPFSLTYSAALLVMERGLRQRSRPGPKSSTAPGGFAALAGD